jgi:hypothetical protein
MRQDESDEIDRTDVDGARGRGLAISVPGVSSDLSRFIAC